MRWLEKFDVRFWGLSGKFRVAALYCAGAYASAGKVWRPGIDRTYASARGIPCVESESLTLRIPYVESESLTLRGCSFFTRVALRVVAGHLMTVELMSKATCLQVAAGALVLKRVQCPDASNKFATTRAQSAAGRARLGNYEGVVSRQRGAARTAAPLAVGIGCPE